MRKRRIIGAIFLISALVFVFLFLDALVGINTRGRLLVCENTLKAVACAIELYRADFNGALPPSLLELKPYIEKRYLHGEQGLPRCVGNRNEKEGSNTWSYVYDPALSNNHVRPICWDSKSHRIKHLFLPDSLRWNILYSDGHVETLNDRKLFKELLRFVSKKPGALAQINLPDERRRSTWPVFLIGAAAGMVFLYIVLLVKKKLSSL